MIEHHYLQGCVWRIGLFWLYKVHSDGVGEKAVYFESRLCGCATASDDLAMKQLYSSKTRERNLEAQI